MKTIVFFNALVFVFLWLLSLCQGTETDGELSNRVLSRKRRYLIFPEGASFQLGNSPIIAMNKHNGL